MTKLREEKPQSLLRLKEASHGIKSKNMRTQPLNTSLRHGDFTVLMPTYNRSDLELLFEEAISSVYTNTIKPKEVIVVVDGKVSKRFEITIYRLQKEFNYRVIWLSENQGLTKALNIGLAEITTKYTFRADGDDVNHSDRFDAIYTKLNEGYDLVGSWIQERDIEGRILKCRKVPAHHETIKRTMKYRNPFNHMTVGYSTNLAKEVGGYPDIYLREDYGLWASMLEAGALSANVEKVLVTATTGRGLHARRSGFRYVQAEANIQKHLLKTKLSYFQVAAIVGIARALIFSLPRPFLSYIYKTFLRG